MPTLHWIGKDKVINHHIDVPFKVLEHSYGFDDGIQTKQETQSGNKIIHGDNLEALKALLPEYEGKVKCIYIDPPYNTGNESWVYNDNVNDPKIKKWLGQVVGKEAEDLTRHDKWLCMMYPRLKLLQKLLAEDGVIFISIDDIEASFLKLVCDEIFGRNKFLGQLIWKSRQNKDNRNTSRISIDHEYVICYGHKLNGLERDKSQFSNPDNDKRGDWVSANMVGLADKKARPNLHYNLINPETNIDYGCPKMGWRYDINTMTKLINEGRILWPKNKDGRPRKKQFIGDYKEEVTGFSSIIGTEVYTRDGTNALREIFNDKKFDFPKPIDFVKTIIDQATAKNSIVLDSFSGSGTTAHAVLNLNKEDNGKRKFILIEMEDYAETITAERVKRVINGYGKVEGTLGSFDFYELGQPIFLEDGNLNELVALEKIRQYVFYTETKTSIGTNKLEDNKHFLGIQNNTAYYFNYEPEEVTTLDHEFLATIKTQAEQYIIYADNCLLTQDFLTKHHIIFKKIPRDITRF
ncbi:site-specific DNA-methyltransferase [Arcicella aquatica]|uniref:site-specific DNA-methyltransferase (adenine-specific) n=1 Tax=Arcicella aquatica TaxID=217141 RepID=A0ABU5QJ87_9BACT|nr:site-specific DNA-methyltransferase [Arcicella aquatica]MEA5257113.1 site-specific DNA-methyltransferase [Arcicella aquatica]